MPVKYTIVQRGNPSNPSEPKKFYASPKADGEVSFEDLSAEIAEQSTTVSDTDVLAVLHSLNKILSRHLEGGKIVRFGEFGSFQVSFSSSGVSKEEEVNPSQIRSAKINFRPGAKLKKTLLGLKYEKYKSK
ncbi:HU family DNA-binding protein [Riemerella columbina]|uniref:HU family DNA-binding protein n=1 Tax=Riemerella columbina TaxID=103810 RepID=UPI000371C980|nr:HU family DNA-binding protein [Riemerella columbina]